MKMNDGYETRRVVSRLLEDSKNLRIHARTRLGAYPVKHLLEIISEVGELDRTLREIVNRQMQEKTGDLRPFIQDVRK